MPTVTANDNQKIGSNLSIFWRFMEREEQIWRHDDEFWQLDKLSFC